MSYEYFYPGTKYSLESSIYGNSPPYAPNAMKLSELGLTTDGRTANQLLEISNKLNTGAKVMELSASDPTLLDSIPKQQFKEINRLTKLTGGEVTLHGPQVEASGFSRDGWSETSRKVAESQISQAVERAHELNPDGNVPVTFHSTAMLPEALERVKGEKGDVSKLMWIVDPRTGRTDVIRETEKHFPLEKGEPKEFNPKIELERRNKDIWTQEIGQINFSALRGEEIVRDIERQAEKIRPDVNPDELEEAKKNFFRAYAESTKTPEAFEKLPADIKQSMEDEFRMLDHASIFLKESYRGLRDMYNMAYKDAKPEDKKKLDDFKKEIAPFVEKGIERDSEKLEQFAELVRKGIKVLNNVEAPNIFRPLNEFAIEKSSQTFATAALHGYKQFKDKAPIVTIENPPAGSGLSRAEDLRTLIEASRKSFVEQAKKEGISEGEAKKASEKLIGATWDVGHINMMRKYGYDKSDVIKETEKIAPYVKHVHLSDNFGQEHTELPMGMGNVPIKEILEKLGKEGFEGKKIIEAFQWWQHVKTPPLVPTLEAFGSPLYPMLAGPTWTQASTTYGNYFAFPSSYFPEQHFSLYGGGFSSLPQELGGQVPGRQSRMTGTPMD